MVDVRSCRLLAASACLLLAAGCRGDTAPIVESDVALVLGTVEHTLVGPGGRRGMLRADSAVVPEALGTLVLIRPHLRLDSSATRPAPVELRADTGLLDMTTGIVRLLRPGTVVGASTALIGRDTVVYDAAGDSLTATPAPAPPGNGS